MNKLQNLLEECTQKGIIKIVVSNPRKGEKKTRIEIRPFEQKGVILYQTASYNNNQVYHKNRTREELIWFVKECTTEYKQINIFCPTEQISVLISKKGKVTIKRQKNTAVKELSLQHNRKKQYILPEDKPVSFLVELGIQTSQGKLVDKKIKKFKQINRFLEFVKDVEKELPEDKPVTIIDFGCGKSYLTFAVYYYLHEMQKKEVNIIRLDLKETVIHHCNELAEKFGYQEHLKFYHGDISDYEGVDQVDMVMTLHACDVATDYALHKAVLWNAKVILSVPCCQHEVNKQIQSQLLQPLLKYGILKERMSALITDGLRASILEQEGYEVQILEFIDMEHTPKNLLIRGVKRGKKEPAKEKEAYAGLCDALHIHTTLEKLLEDR